MRPAFELNLRLRADGRWLSGFQMCPRRMGRLRGRDTFKGYNRDTKFFTPHPSKLGEDEFSRKEKKWAN